MTTNHFRQRNFLGFRVDDWIEPELLTYMENAIINRKPINIWGISVPIISLVRKYPQVVDFSKQFDIVVPDGAGIPLIIRFFRQRVRKHIGLPYVAKSMIELAAQKGYRLMILGGTPEINRDASERLQRRYPALKLCPGLHGYYQQKDEMEVVQYIKESRPDILLVGMSTPKKELFLLKWTNFMQVPVCIACGGYIDILAGKTNLPPKFIENMALSWFWRFMQEPKRLFSNIFINELLFIFYILPRAMMHRFGYTGKFPHISFLIKNKH
jgi:N-acetylglucosaminyldiphosphoundecaprenol N-acetyl-beta-D-mannosaminyltransferase